MESFERILAESRFFEGLDHDLLEQIASCAKHVSYDQGEMVYHEGEEADQFLLILQGKIAIELHAGHRGSITLQTLDHGDVLGWSWLFPPHQRRFDARAMEPTAAVALDGACLRKQIEVHHRLGYELLKRFSRVVVDRLQAASRQLLDMYGKHV